MKSATIDELFDLIGAHDQGNDDRGAAAPDTVEALRASLASYFAERESVVTVLGLDIYRYSQMADDAQRLIPWLFDYFRLVAATFCTREQLLFKEPKEEQPGNFVHTGDGGFQILPTPLHALAYASFFQMVLSLYNGFFMYPNLRRLIGPLTVRYAITTARLFRHGHNFFGQAIIRNARILARDTLNRCLVDEDSVSWFQEHVVNLESLAVVSREDIERITMLSSVTKDASSLLFQLRGEPRAFKSIHLQKIGNLQSKEATLSVYNLHVQVEISWSRKDVGIQQPVLVTLGNLNTAGI